MSGFLFLQNFGLCVFVCGGIKFIISNALGFFSDFLKISLAAGGYYIII